METIFQGETSGRQQLGDKSETSEGQVGDKRRQVGEKLKGGREGWERRVGAGDKWRNVGQVEAKWGTSGRQKLKSGR